LSSSPPPTSDGFDDLFGRLFFELLELFGDSPSLSSSSPPTSDGFDDFDDFDSFDDEPAAAADDDDFDFLPLFLDGESISRKKGIEKSIELKSTSTVSPYSNCAPPYLISFSTSMTSPPL